MLTFSSAAGCILFAGLPANVQIFHDRVLVPADIESPVFTRFCFDESFEYLLGGEAEIGLGLINLSIKLDQRLSDFLDEAVQVVVGLPRVLGAQDPCEMAYGLGI
jgi:hypothetical protein